MLKKLPERPQLEMFKTVLTSFIHPEHELCLLAREIKKLKHQLRFAKRPKNLKKMHKAQVRLQKIAHKIYEDVTGKLSEEQQVQYKQILTVLIKVLTQKQDDKHKIYSIHEPKVLCIGKGKEHKPYEFGSKSSFAYTRKGGIIVGAMSIEGNMFDGHTLKPQIEQVKEMTGYVP